MLGNGRDLNHLRVAEIFFSIQGEGPSMGRRAVFLRLAMCNLMCGGDGTAFDKGLHDGATWRCDTIEVWMKGKDYLPNTLLDLLEQLGHLKELKNGAHLIVTGGEPMLQQTGLIKFLNLLHERAGHIFVEIETNGTIEPQIALLAMTDQINCSPKLANSGVRKEKRIKAALESYASYDRAIFKFVIADEIDAIEVERDFLANYPIEKNRVWFMPPSSTREQLNERSEHVAELCKRFGVNFSSRLQLGIWDKAVGV